MARIIAVCNSQSKRTSPSWSLKFLDIDDNRPARFFRSVSGWLSKVSGQETEVV